MRVTPQDFTPCIHITDSDFASITQDGALCDANGQLGPDEFADVIRRQVGGLIELEAQHTVSPWPVMVGFVVIMIVVVFNPVLPTSFRRRVPSWCALCASACPQIAIFMRIPQIVVITQCAGGPTRTLS